VAGGTPADTHSRTAFGGATWQPSRRSVLDVFMPAAAQRESRWADSDGVLEMREADAFHDGRSAYDSRRMYGRATLIENERQSAMVFAASRGIPLDQMIVNHRDRQLREIDALIAQLDALGEGAQPDIQHLIRWRERLAESPDVFFEYRHEMAELDLRGQVRQLRAWLPEAVDALSMIRTERLESCMQGARSMPDFIACVTAQLDRLEIFAPMAGGFNAAVQTADDHHLIVLQRGIHDLLSEVMKLIVRHCVQFVDDGHTPRYAVRSLRDYPDVFARALERVNGLIKLARGEIHAHEVEIGDLSHEQTELALRLLAGGLAFVYLHEFAHVLIERRAMPAHTEDACDEFAARLIIASGDPAYVCGMCIAVELLESIAMMDDAGGWTATHPPIANRAKHIQLLIEEKKADLDPAFDALLDITSRVTEEQFFRTETSNALREYLEVALAGVDLPCDVDIRRCIATAISTSAIGLPKIEEDAIVSLQFDGKQRFRVVRYDLHAAIAAAASATGGLVGATNRWVIGAAVVAALASLKSLTRELSATEGAVLYALYLRHSEPVSRSVLESDVEHILPGRVDRAEFSSAVQSLLGIGTVREAGSAYRLAEYVLVRMPWPPSLTPRNA
jgi:hypothetical protein